VLIAKIRLSLEATGLSSVVYLIGFRLDKGRAWRRGLRLQVVPTTFQPKFAERRQFNLILLL